MIALVLAAGLEAGSAEAGSADAEYALELLYDGSTDTALALLSQLEEKHPEDPLAPYFEALAMAWKIEQRPESDSLDRELEQSVARAVAKADARLLKDRGDTRARLARGAAHGVRSRLHLVRREGGQAARAAVRMREDLLSLLEIEPDDKDALFGVGLYDYYADVLPRLAKLVRFLAGMPGGDRERGLARIEAAKEGAVFHGTEVRAQLYELYAFYEDKPDRAYEEIVILRKRYPNSPLWALKLAEHQRLRLGLYAESAAVARETLAAVEGGHPNFAPVVGAMARLSLGESLLLDLRTSEAREALLAVKEGTPEAPWIRARAELGLGRSLELEGDRAGAEVHYRLASSATDRETRRVAQRALAKPLPAGGVRASVLLARARREREAGREDEATLACREAYAAWPRSREAALCVAEDDLRSGRVEAAREGLARLVLVDGDRTEPPWVRPWARLLMGCVHDLAGEREAALREYKLVWEEPLGHEDLRERAAQGLRHPYRTREANPGAARASDYTK